MRVNFLEVMNQKDNKSVIINQLLTDFRNQEDVMAGEEFVTEDGNYDIQISVKGINKIISLDTEKFIDWIVEEFEHQSKREQNLIEATNIFINSVGKVLEEENY